MSSRSFLALIALSLAACSPGDPAEGASGPGQAPDTGRRETAVFAGGCFWSVEANFEAMPGVVSAVSGFAGGSTANPTYEQVVRGGSGHLEAVQVTFDPGRISDRQLVDRFWTTIDPTDPDGQFCDQGPSYATAVFAGPGQKAAAEASRRAATRRLGRGGGVNRRLAARRPSHPQTIRPQQCVSRATRPDCHITVTRMSSHFPTGPVEGAGFQPAMAGRWAFALFFIGDR